VQFTFGDLSGTSGAPGGAGAFVFSNQWSLDLTLSCFNSEFKFNGHAAGSHYCPPMIVIKDPHAVGYVQFEKCVAGIQYTICNHGSASALPVMYKQTGATTGAAVYGGNQPQLEQNQCASCFCVCDDLSAPCIPGAYTNTHFLCT
jgi:hypothetical protein